MVREQSGAEAGLPRVNSLPDLNREGGDVLDDRLLIVRQERQRPRNRGLLGVGQFLDEYVGFLRHYNLDSNGVVPEYRGLINDYYALLEAVQEDPIPVPTP